MRTDDVADTVGEEDEGGCGDALGVAAHVAGGDLQGEDEGGDKRTRLLSLASWEGRKGQGGGGGYNVVAE